MGENNIILAAPLADVLGSVRFKFNASSSDVLSSERRVTRQATLDGDVVLNDLGFSDGDRTFNISFTNNKTLLESVKRLHRTYATITISTDEGLFLGVIVAINTSGNEVKMRIYIKEKLTS